MTRAPGQRKSAAACRVLVVGNVALDRNGDSWLPGGPSLYSSLVLRSLGATVEVVSHLERDYPCPTSLNITSAGSGPVPRFANSYSDGGERTQLLLEQGTPIDSAVIPRGSYDGLLVTPAYHELDDLLTSGALDGLVAGHQAIELQGFLRDTDAAGRIKPRTSPGALLAGRLPTKSSLFLSDEDTGDAVGLARELASEGHTVFLTRRTRPVEIYSDGSMTRVSTIPADELDPTGAGDCFAAACLLRLCEGSSPRDAARFGVAAAAIMVEGRGVGHLPTRDAVERRMTGVPV